MKNEMTLAFDSISENEAFARVAVAAFVTQLNPTLEEVMKAWGSPIFIRLWSLSIPAVPSRSVLVWDLCLWKPSWMKYRWSQSRGWELQ